MSSYRVDVYVDDNYVKTVYRPAESEEQLQEKLYEEFQPVFDIEEQD